MENFKPSLDWAHEFVPSMLWILKTYAITAVLSLLVLVLLAKFTVWGRQYWRITGDYFKGRKSVGVWAWVAVLLLSTIISVRLDVLLSYYGNDLFTSLQVAFQGRGADNDEMRESGIHGFWMSLIVFAILATIYISRVMLDIYLTQRFIIRWRMWLTDRVTCDWLDGRAYY
ncbi:MAG TPA: SbmA/BacA-like family transporter, partial [Mycobacterium sp.]|nr:SbmA/BacA-like family transporter [Mycobacterium sp.]